MIQSAGVNNSVSKLLPFEANEGINHESGPYTIFTAKYIKNNIWRGKNEE